MNDYEEMVAKYGLIEEAQVGTNEFGEAVIVSIDEECACVTTIQKNGWARINVYHKDGTCEETYRR